MHFFGYGSVISTPEVWPGGIFAYATLPPEDIPSFTVSSWERPHNANRPAPSLMVTAAGKSSSGSKSTNAPATGCLPADVISTIVPDTDRDPGAVCAVEAVTFAFETSARSTTISPWSVTGAAAHCWTYPSL